MFSNYHNKADPNGDKNYKVDISVSDTDRHPGSESNYGTVSNDDASSSSNANDNHLKQLPAQNHKKLTTPYLHLQPD